MLTVAQAIATFGVTADDHLDRQAKIPVLSGLQLQGDVAVVPSGLPPARTPIPKTGVPVVRGQVEANTHLLLAIGDAFFTPVRSWDATLVGVLTVTEGATAYLAHPEHAFIGIGPGTYEVRRQREQGDRTRLVLD